jgi:hypothetical protein
MPHNSVSRGAQVAKLYKSLSMLYMPIISVYKHIQNTMAGAHMQVCPYFPFTGLPSKFNITPV